MSNTKLFLLIGTSLSFLPLIVNAQCVETTNCEALGYTETSCNGGKGIKCPFGNKWACLATASDFEQQFCTTYGFKYACSGTGYSGGAGKACNGKYVSCNCASGYKWNGTSCVKESCSSAYQYTCSGTGYTGGAGTACGGKYASCLCSSNYEWKNGSCQKKGISGAQGNLYYCEGKVVAVKTSGMDFYIAMRNLGQKNWYAGDQACKDYIFCGSIKGSLPTYKQLQTIYKNKDELNNLLSSNGGTKIIDSFSSRYWSSTVQGNDPYDPDHGNIDMYFGSPNGTSVPNSHPSYILPVF